MLRQRQAEVFGRAQALSNQPFQPFTGQRFAGFTPDQIASFEAARRAAGAGAGTLQEAIGATRGALDFSTPDINAERIGAERVIAGQFTDKDINPYLNPFISGVVDTSLQDIERARREAQAQTTSRALASKAFGGSGSGVAAALTNREFANTAARTAAQLRAQGFESAAARVEADLNRSLQAGSLNQAAALQASQANQAAALRAAETSASNRLAAAGLRLGAAGQLAGFAGQEQGQAAFGADLLSRIGGQQQALEQAQRDFEFDEFNLNRLKPYQDFENLYRAASFGPYGSTTRSTRTSPNPNRGSFLNTALGLGLTLGGFALGGPAGAAAGSTFLGGSGANV